MIDGMYNQFQLDKIINRPVEYRKQVQQDDYSYAIDLTPICSIENNQLRVISHLDNETRNYQLVNQSKDRLTHQGNIIDKLTLMIKGKPIKEDSESDHDDEVFQINRYFNSEVNNYETMTKGLCRRCKKPGHFEKWCVEEIQEEIKICNYCLGPHHHSKCPNSLCFKCNGVGHMSRDCQNNDKKCHRCFKRGHKSKDCTIIKIEDFNIEGEDKSELKKLKCLNCGHKGHLNCSKIYSSNKFHCFDDLYGEHSLPKKSSKSKHKQKPTVDEVRRKIKKDFEFNVKKQKSHKYESESEYSVWSEISPDSKRKLNNKYAKKRRNRN